MPRSIQWTAGEKERLPILWAEGKTMSDCADILSGRFGRHITRCAIAGMIHRLDLPKRIRVKKPPRPKKLRVRKLKIVKHTNEAREAAMEKIEIARINPAPVPIKDDQSKTLFELTNVTCRWPYGDPGNGLFYCGHEGADLAAGRPYCCEHTSMATQIPQRRAA